MQQVAVGQVRPVQVISSPPLPNCLLLVPIYIEVDVLATAIIAKKRDSMELTTEEIEFFIRGFVAQKIPNYQMSAMAMAILCRGMQPREIADLTRVMRDSGVCLSRVTDRPRVDKHSTGGLGDKTSLILAPLLACFDLDVPMLSGRGLGITGGTLDKLESIDGYRCDLTHDEINQQLRRIGCVITGTTPDIAPADKALYALRDVTGTVPSIALITASILSKKLSESLDALMLDVKWGSGAFMQTYDEAQKLADSLVNTGTQMGQRTFSLMSDMNQPLGRMVGNACEVNESLDTLRGEGPSDVRDLTIALCAPLLLATGKATSFEQATAELEKCIDQGHAMRRFQKMVEAQNGKFVDRLPLADELVLECSATGIIQRMDGQRIGQSVIQLGGGRRELMQPIDHGVGLEMLVRLGDRVQAGQPWVRVFARNNDTRDAAIQTLQSSLKIG